ncbi:MAG: hypothetical protein AAF734_09770 [Bacteroidota bacterium]
MKINSNYFKNVVAIGAFMVMILLIVLAYLDKKKDDKDLKENARYTLGTTLETFYQYRGNKQLKYSYQVKGKIYQGFVLYKRGVKVQGGRYYVAFSTTDPRNSKFLYNYAVPSEIQNVPPEGWKTLPRYEKTFIDL